MLVPWRVNIFLKNIYPDFHLPPHLDLEQQMLVLLLPGVESVKAKIKGKKNDLSFNTSTL